MDAGNNGNGGPPSSGIRKLRAVLLSRRRLSALRESHADRSLIYLEGDIPLASFAAAYSKVGNITMYGDQSGKIASEVIDRTTQLFDGLSKSLGFDVKAAVGGALAAKLVGDAPASRQKKPDGDKEA